MSLISTLDASLTESEPPIEVLVADSSPIQSRLLMGALQRRPEFNVQSCRIESEAILTAIADHPVDVVLLSQERLAGRWDGVAILRRIHLAHPQVSLILLIDTFDREFVVNAFRAGATGLFHFSESSLRALCKCIHAVHRGQIWINNEQLHFLLDVVAHTPTMRVVNAKGAQLLTPREEQVVALVAEGLTNKDIACELGLSENTIKKYVFRVFDKLGISSRVELVLYAVSSGNTCPAEWLPVGG